METEDNQPVQENPQTSMQGNPVNLGNGQPATRDDNLHEISHKDQLDANNNKAAHSGLHREAEYNLYHKYDDEEIAEEHGDVDLESNQVQQPSEPLEPKQPVESNQPKDEERSPVESDESPLLEKSEPEDVKEEEKDQSQKDEAWQSSESGEVKQQDVPMINIRENENLPMETEENEPEKQVAEELPEEVPEKISEEAQKEKPTETHEEKVKKVSEEFLEVKEEKEPEFEVEYKPEVQVETQQMEVEEEMPVKETERMPEQPIEEPQITEETSQKVEILPEVSQPQITKKTAKGSRGRKGKPGKSVESKLAKREEMSPSKDEKIYRKASQESYQPSIHSEREGPVAKHELRHLGKELNRTAESVVYYSEGPIDPHHFGPCIIKHRLPKKYTAKKVQESSLNKLKQEVGNLAKARNLGLPVPAIYAFNLKHKLVCLEYFKNHISLLEYLNSKSDDYDDDTIIEMRKIFTSIGNYLAELHNGNIIHGSLSVSNILLDNAKHNVKFISFGLSAASGNIEEKAIDLYSFVNSFPATAEEYMRYDDLTHCVYTGYTAKSNKLDSVVQRLQKIKQKLKGKAQ